MDVECAPQKPQSTFERFSAEMEHKLEYLVCALGQQQVKEVILNLWREDADTCEAYKDTFQLKDK